MFPGQCGNTAFFFKSQPDQFHFEFRGIVFPGKSFFSAHEVSTCKISGCLSYRILDSGPDGTQTTLTLKRTILALPESNVIHAGYGSYAVIEVDLDGGDKAFYFVAFRAFREKKKLRLHVTSAYPISEKQKGKSVKFFTIAYNLLRNKQLPQPSK